MFNLFFNVLKWIMIVICMVYVVLAFLGIFIPVLMIVSLICAVCLLPLAVCMVHAHIKGYTKHDYKFGNFTITVTTNKGRRYKKD